MSSLSSRQRRCLQALAVQGEWPAARGDHGWRGVAGQAPWAADSRRLLASLARLGLVVDESTTTVGRLPSTGLGLSLRARRYVITERGKVIADTLSKR
ncbi:hypothetical protein [Mycolicibacterium fortuitum]|uniref:hypothetical protein n=1 Tax=Mycolicibacterium fortuitum TaxID=1766 RepID=UPI0007EB5349|nr:hypothetical protein [Mycolicibacterium fortuitum]OBF77065.1 hypothetical protein A5751_23070 [Mycolicibacterium fortuitum]